MDDLKQRELDLWTRYKTGGDIDAKKELIASLKPVINSQVSKFKASGLPIVAIRLEGVNLTSQAIDTYDPSKAQLNTHVVNTLKKLNRFVTNYQNVGHIPEPRALMIGKYWACFENLKEEFGREPTAVELSDAMHLPLIEIERLQLELRKDLSIEYSGGDPDEAEGFYIYTRDVDESKKDNAIQFVYFEADPIDKKILEYVFGLNGTQKLNFGAIAKKLKLSETELNKRKKDLAVQIAELLK